MEGLLVEALVAQGCPLDATRSIVRFATLVTYPQAPWLLDVLDHWYFGTSVEVSREEFSEGALEVAEMIRDSNAEIVDRLRRGENGPRPYWDIPDAPDTPPA